MCDQTFSHLLPLPKALRAVWVCLEDYRQSVQEASLERGAGVIRIAGMLLQKKVYLFWDRGS